MKYYCYIIFSASHKRFYHGFTHDLDARLKEHNLGKVKSTKGFRPWVIVYTEEFDSQEKAFLREMYFKTSSGRRFLKPIKDRILNEVEGSPPA